VALGLAPQESPASFRQRLEAATTAFAADDILYLADLWGGTPANVVLDHCARAPAARRWAVVGGLSLGMLVEAIVRRDSVSGVAELARAVAVSGRGQVQLRVGEGCPPDG
jgi:mannose PTS system EIIAB component